MNEHRIEDVGAPNPRQAEVDRIREAAAANLGHGERQGAARQAAARVSEELRGRDETSRPGRAD